MITQDIRLRQVILWQYEEAKRLIGLVDILQAGYDRYHKDFWERWYKDVFNIDTATDFGLTIWSKILGIKFNVAFEPQSDKIAWGFGNKRRRFGHDSNYGSRSGGNVTLTTAQKRLVIKSRYFELTQRPTQDNINEFLRENFWTDEGMVYVHDPQDMTFLLYTFLYKPDPWIQFLLDNFDILPRPAGVGVSVNIFDKQSWGVSRERLNFAPPSNFGKSGVE